MVVDITLNSSQFNLQNSAVMRAVVGSKIDYINRTNIQLRSG